MKVCFVNTYFPPYRGGAETYVYNLSRCLSNLGHSVEVFCADHLQSSVSTERSASFPNKVEVHRLRPIFTLYGTPIIPSLYWHLMAFDGDIIHVNFPNPFNTFIGGLVSMRKKVPSVITWHNDLPHVSSCARTLVFIHNIFASYYLRWYDKIIATTKRYADLSLMLQRWQPLVQVIHNGVDCGVFNPQVNDEYVRAIHGLEGYKIILFTGALTKWHGYKGLDVLIRAFKIVKKKMKDVRLLIVGDGVLRWYYQEFCKKLSLIDDTVFALDVPDAILPQYYAACDVFVLPSKDQSEGFGLVILEANACGKPVIASMVGGVPEVVIDGYNGMLVQPNSPKDLANALTILLSDQELMLEMGKRGREWAELHDWNIIARAVQEIYEELLCGLTR